MSKPQTLLQAQLLSMIANDTGLSINIVRKVLESYEKIALDELLNYKKVPLPGSMGYLRLTLTTSKTRKVDLELTSKEAIIEPSLKTTANFSQPWKKKLKEDIRSEKLIHILLNK